MMIPYLLILACSLGNKLSLDVLVSESFILDVLILIFTNRPLVTDNPEFVIGEGSFCSGGHGAFH